MRRFIFAWTRFDPAAAFGAAKLWPQSERREPLIGAALYCAAFHDPGAARSLFLMVREHQHANFLHGMMVAGWVAGGRVTAATRYIASLPASPGRELITATVTQEIAKRGIDPLIDWAEEILTSADADFRATVFVKTAETLMATDPIRAEAWVAPHIGQKYMADLIWPFARLWMNKSFRPVMKWLMTLPPSKERSDAVEKAFEYWHEHHPTHATRWLRTARPADVLDPAVLVMVKHERSRSPRAAIDWALRIHDKRERELMLATVGRLWFLKDPSAARQWLEVSGLPESARRYVREGDPQQSR